MQAVPIRNSAMEVALETHETENGTIVMAASPEPEIVGELKALNETVRQRGGCDVVINFSQVDIVTSSSLSALLRLHKLVHDSGHALTLCCLSPATQGILAVTGLKGVFDIREEPVGRRVSDTQLADPIDTKDIVPSDNDDGQRPNTQVAHAPSSLTPIWEPSSS
jgi:anti-anti-sigma factor